MVASILNGKGTYFKILIISRANRLPCKFVGRWKSIQCEHCQPFLEQVSLEHGCKPCYTTCSGKGVFGSVGDQVEDCEKAGEKLLFPQNWLRLHAKNIFEPLQKGELRGKLPHPNLGKPPALIKASLHWAWRSQFGSKTILHKWK